MRIRLAYFTLVVFCFNKLFTNANYVELRAKLVEAIKLLRDTTEDCERSSKDFMEAQFADVTKSKTILNKASMIRLVFQQFLFRDCSEVYERGYRVSGVYPMWLQQGYRYALFYCDMDTVSDLTNKRGWTVIQKRFDGSVDFDRKWNEYVKGFGKLKGEHWIGLENIYSVLRQVSSKTMSFGIRPSRLRIDFEDWDGLKAYTEIEKFAIDRAENHYSVALASRFFGAAKYNGTFNGPLGAGSFSTIDNVNTRRDCPRMRTGGWWFPDTEFCGGSNLNAHRSKQKATMGLQNIYWNAWPNKHGISAGLRRVSMKIQY